MQLFFFKKPSKISSEEYLELKKDIDKVRISVEALQLDVDLYKKKLRSKAGIAKDEKLESDSKDLWGGILVPEK